MLTELPLSIMILDTRLMSKVTIRASLCGKCTVDPSESENDIGLFGANGEPVNIMGYLLLRASLVLMALSWEVVPSIRESPKMASISGYWMVRLSGYGTPSCPFFTLVSEGCLRLRTNFWR